MSVPESAISNTYALSLLLLLLLLFLLSLGGWLVCIHLHVNTNSVLHHDEELHVVDLAIAICVHSLKQLLDHLFCEQEVLALQGRTQLILADLSAVIRVEEGEGGSQMALLQVVVTLETRCDELSVVDHAVLVRVDDVHGVEDLNVG